MNVPAECPSKSLNIVLRCVVKPQIEPFNFNEINERKSLKVFCTVTGDLPLDIVWLKDEQILVPTESRRVQRWDDFSVVLSLSTISVNDSGNYTCRAKNVAGEAYFTSTLYVKGQCWRVAAPLGVFFLQLVLFSLLLPLRTECCDRVARALMSIISPTLFCKVEYF